MINREQIEKVVPHRDPFLFLDEITKLEAGKYAEGRWFIREDFFAFQGHFPGYPIMPGVLMVEAVSQLGAFVVLSQEEYAGKLPLFAGIKSAKFRHPVRPGDTVEMKVEITKLSKIGGKGKGAAYVEGQLACEAEIVFAFA